MSTLASTAVRCHICHTGGLDECSSYGALTRIASDSTLWKSGGRLAVCAACGAVQKPITPEWREEADEIYRRYHIYHVSGGVEQQVFSDGTGLSRSVRLAEFLRLHSPVLPAQARHLDIGCGNGAFLRGLSSFFPSWNLFGSEVSEKYKAVVTAIPGVRDFYTQDLLSIPGKFDSISLVHVLEHIPDPISFLANIKTKLTSAGVLFVEVPYFVDNPFDLLIADHSSHFTPQTLGSVIRKAGFRVRAQSSTWVAKELSFVASPEDSSQTAEAGTEILKDRVLGSLRWLQDVLSLARSMHQQRGIFGTSNAATWLHGELQGAVEFFVDEDKNKVGQQLYGKPIFSPEEAPRDATVVFPLPFQIACHVSERLKGKGVKFEMLLPPRF